MTFKLLSTLAASALSIAAFSSATADTPKRMINVMVLPDDADVDSLPYSSDVHYRVTAELREQMRVYGYNILDNDGVMARIGWQEIGDRISRRDKLALANAACTDGDATTCPRMIVFVKTRAGVERLGNTGAVAQVRLQGDIVDARTNASMGNWQPVRDKFTAPYPCNNFCLDEVIGDNAYDIASDLGDVLRIKLDDTLATLEPEYRLAGNTVASGYDSANVRTDYFITFRRFEFSEIRSMLDVMETQFGGRAELGDSEGNVNAWKQNYLSDHNMTELTSRFYQLLGDMGYSEDEYRITSREGRYVEIERILR